MGMLLSRHRVVSPNATTSAVTSFETAGNEAVKALKEDLVKAENNEPIAEEVVETEPKVEYTRTAINRMSTNELRKLGKEYKIPGAHNMSGAKLKEALIKKLGL